MSDATIPAEVQVTSTATTEAEGMNKKLGFIAMLLSATGMGLVGTLGRLSTPIDPATGQKYIIGDFLATGRMITGALGFLVIIMIAKKLPELKSTKLSFAVVAGGVCIGASLALYVSSTLMTSIANAVFLIYTGPLFSALLARIFRKEKISVFQGACLALVFIGMLMTIGIISWDNGLRFGLELGADPNMPNKVLGDLFGLGSGLFYGLALFFYRYRPDISSEVRGFWNFTFGAVGALLVLVVRMATLDPTNAFEVMTPTNWGWAAVLFLVCGLFAIGLLVVAGKNLYAVELSTVSYWECFVALVLGAWVWSESLSMMGAIGGLLIILGGMAPILTFVRNRKKGVLQEAPAMVAAVGDDESGGQQPH